ncbi:MAG: deoxyribodipyrimidine photo-lyase, partial [Parvibaculum sp.]
MPKKKTDETPAPVILWFRRDLRLDDNPALAAAAARSGPVLPLFILDPEEEIGGASRWWLHGSLEALGESLARLGSLLVLRKGDPLKLLPAIVEETGASAVFWNRCYEPHAISRDKALKSALTEKAVEVKSFAASLLAEPWEVETGSGGPYKVFTPFWRALS